MTWNYCPECGHRVYQHDAGGCTHYDLEDVACADPQCDVDTSTKRIVCDCKVPHPILMHAEPAP